MHEQRQIMLRTNSEANIHVELQRSRVSLCFRLQHDDGRRYTAGRDCSRPQNEQNKHDALTRHGCSFTLLHLLILGSDWPAATLYHPVKIFVRNVRPGNSKTMYFNLPKRTQVFVLSECQYLKGRMN